MFCPNCAARNSNDQRFCRGCGMSLEQVNAVLTEQFPGRESKELERKVRRLERFGQFAFGGFAIVVGIAILAIIYAIVVNMILTGQRPWFGALLIAFITLAGLTLAWVVLNEDLKEKRKALSKHRDFGPIHEHDIVTNKLLNQPPAGHIPSVIEDTTDLLPVKNRTRKLGD